MEAYPSRSEREVAEALLLLASNPPHLTFLSPSSSSRCFSNPIFTKTTDRSLSCHEDTSPTDSKSRSCSSSLTSDGEASRSTDPLRVLAVATRFHDFKLKVVKRARSKLKRSYDQRRRNLSGMWTKSAFITPASSKHSSEISIVSSVVHSGVRKQPMRVGKMVSVPVFRSRGFKKLKKRREEVIKFGYMKRRADAILNFLSAGCASEVRIRQVLGDSPDTSKALRILLKMEEIKRFGAGGNKDPYMYMVVESRSDVDSV